MISANLPNVIKLTKPAVLLCMLSLTGCEAPTYHPGLDLPLLGGEETSFVIQPGGGELKLRDAVAVAKVIRKYKDLTQREQALVKLAVRRHIDGLVATELRQLEQQAAPERARIRALPDAGERKRAQEAVSAKLQVEAVRRVEARLDAALAVPLVAARGQSVVAFAKVAGQDIRVASEAYEAEMPRSPVDKIKLEVAGKLPGLDGATGGASTAHVVKPERPIRIE
jgi:hypothetical protein